jgi:hypothetical protein
MLVSTDRVSVMCRESSYQLRVPTVLFLQRAACTVQSYAARTFDLR